MQQFHFTYCNPGESLSGRRGWVIRAASPGVSEEQMLSLLRFVGCERPRDVAFDELPMRLAFIDGGDWQLIAHQRFIPSEQADAGGNYFAHAVLTTAGEVDGLSAVATWGSPDWKQANYPGRDPLPVLKALPSGGSVTPRTVQERLQRDDHFVQWAQLAVEGAMLAIAQGGRLFIAAESADVARLVGVIATVFPPSQRGLVTFSTFESNPLDTFARVLVTGAMITRKQNGGLPQACYTAPNYGLDTVSGSSNIPEAGPYAQGTVALLTQSGSDGLSRFLEGVERVGFQSIEEMNFLARAMPTVCNPATLPPEDVLQVLSRPKLARECLKQDERGGFADHVVSWVRKDATGFRPAAQAALSGLLSEDDLGALIRRLMKPAISKVAEEDARNGRDDEVKFWMGTFLPAVGESVEPENWATLVAGLDARKLRPPVASRVRLLEQVAHLPDDGTRIPSLGAIRRSWLDIEAGEFGSARHSSLNSELKLYAVACCLRRAATGGYKFPVDVAAFLSDAAQADALKRTLATALGKDGGWFVTDLIRLCHDRGICLKTLAELMTGPWPLEPTLLESALACEAGRDHAGALGEFVLNAGTSGLGRYSASCPTLREIVEQFVMQVEPSRLLDDACVRAVETVRGGGVRPHTEGGGRRLDAMAIIQGFALRTAQGELRIPQIAEALRLASVPRNSAVSTQVAETLGCYATVDNWQTIVDQFANDLTASPVMLLESLAKGATQKCPDDDLVLAVLRTSAQLVAPQATLGFPQKFAPRRICAYLRDYPDAFVRLFERLSRQATESEFGAVDLFAACYDATGLGSRLNRVFGALPDMGAATIDALLSIVRKGSEISWRNAMGMCLDALSQQKNLLASREALVVIDAYVAGVSPNPAEMHRIFQGLNRLLERQVPLGAAARDRLGSLQVLGKFLRGGRVDAVCLGTALMYFRSEVEVFGTRLPAVAEMGPNLTLHLINACLDLACEPGADKGVAPQLRSALWVTAAHALRAVGRNAIPNFDTWVLQGRHRFSGRGRKWTELKTLATSGLPITLPEPPRTLVSNKIAPTGVGGALPAWCRVMQHQPQTPGSDSESLSKEWVIGIIVVLLVVAAISLWVLYNIYHRPPLCGGPP